MLWKQKCRKFWEQVSICNGALILKDHEVLHESVLPKSAVAKIVDCLPAGRVGLKGPRLGALAVIGSHEDGSHHYSELTSDGATWVTSLIQRAGEPVSITTSWKSLLEMKVHKFVMFTDTEKNWAPMDEVVAMLQEKLQRTGVTVLDCGSKQCEILPPGVNKGGGLKIRFCCFHRVKILSLHRSRLQMININIPFQFYVHTDTVPLPIMRPSFHHFMKYLRCFFLSWESGGTGVQRLLSILNIDTTAAIACGDGVNDIEMLQLVAKGVAMGISLAFSCQAFSGVIFFYIWMLFAD